MNTCILMLPLMKCRNVDSLKETTDLYIMLNQSSLTCFFLQQTISELIFINVYC